MHRYGLTVVIAGLALLCSMGFGAWTQLNSGTTAELYSVHFPEGTQVGYAAGGAPDSLGGVAGIVIKTTDRGTTWQMQDVGNVNVLNSVYFKNNDSGYAVGQRGLALKTTDGGTTWTAMTVPVTDNLTRVQFPGNGQVGYIGVNPPGVGGKVLKTTDGGDNWASISVGGPFVTSYSCGMATDSIGVVFGDSGFIVGTADDTAQDPQTIADLVAVAFSPADPNRGYLIGNDTMLGVIRYTDDGGATPWDSVRCWNVPAFYGVDMPTDDVAYVCGTHGMIQRSLSPRDYVRTTVPTGLTATMCGLCFPNGADTGYAVGAAGVILRTYDGGLPLVWAVAEGNGPAMSRAGIRVVSDPSRHGITFRADADANIVVFDAAGRVVTSCAATEGLNYVPLPEAGVYFVHEAQAQAQAQAVRVVLTE